MATTQQQPEAKPDATRPSPTRGGGASVRRVAYLNDKMYRDSADGAYEIAPALGPHNTTAPYTKYQFDPEAENPPPFKLNVDESLSIEQLLQNTKMQPVLVDPTVEQQLEAAKEAAAKAAEKAAELKAQREAAAAEKAQREAAEGKKPEEKSAK